MNLPVIILGTSPDAELQKVPGCDGVVQMGWEEAEPAAVDVSSAFRPEQTERFHGRLQLRSEMKAGNTNRQKPSSSFQSLLLNMDHTLMALLLWLCSSGVHADETLGLRESIRLVGGSRRCEGQWELNLGEWRPVHIQNFNYGLKEASIICRWLDCGSAVSTKYELTPIMPIWMITSECFLSGSDLKYCAEEQRGFGFIWVTCSESVKLVNGGNGCSGRLEVKVSKSDQSNQGWSSVCEADFDQQDAEVVCREINCGSPTVLKGGLYGEMEAPTWSPQFQCGGHESSLLDCRRSNSARNSCPPGKAVGLTCSEPLRLVGGPRSCEGRLQIRVEGKWRLVTQRSRFWNHNHTEMLCKWLSCGSAVSMEDTESLQKDTSYIYERCIEETSTARGCGWLNAYSAVPVKLNCLEPDRTTDGNLRLTVFTPVFIFCLVLLLLSVTYFIFALCFTYKPTRWQQSGQ